MTSYLCDGCKAVVFAMRPPPISSASSSEEASSTKKIWKIISHNFEDGVKENCHLCLIIQSSLSPQQRQDIRWYCVDDVETTKVKCTIGFLPYASHDNIFILFKMSVVFTTAEAGVATPNNHELMFYLLPSSRLSARRPDNAFTYDCRLCPNFHRIT